MAISKKTLRITAIVLAFLVFGGTAAAGGWYAGRKEATADDSKKTATQSKDTADTSQTDDKKTDTDSGKVTLTLYFADDQAKNLKSETREITKTDNTAKAAVEELIKGPADSTHIGTIPVGLVLQSVLIEGDLARVSFGPSFNDYYPQGSRGESLFIYSIVDTLTGLAGIGKVQFLVDSQPPSVRGNLDISQPFQRDDSIISQ